MNVFESIKMYDPSWKVQDERNFSQGEIDAVKTAQVVSSQYGLSVCFAMKAGGFGYIPIDENSSVSEGQYLDLHKCTLRTLVKEERTPILRVFISED